jgi:hypothetical protein
MSQLANALRQIAKKSMHPNALVHKVQLERARQKYIVRGEIGDGKEDAVALGAPEEQEAKLEKRGVGLNGTNDGVTAIEDRKMEEEFDEKPEVEEESRKGDKLE